MLTRTQRTHLGRLLCAASVVAGVSAAAVLVSGGYSFYLGPIRIASHHALRDIILAVFAFGVAIALLGRDRVDAGAAVALVRLERRSTVLAALLAIVVFVVGIAAGTWCACASDQYGYVSQADLWAAGTLHVAQPLASEVPWPMAEWTLSPLGYRPATYPGAIVPTYAPGLPMVMAAAMKISGSRGAVFLVVPMLGAVTVWATFLLGRRLDTAIIGVIGALLVACSATFLFQLIQPMSDVPVSAWWTVAAVLLFRGTAASAFFAGLACSAAVLTRPNLAPLLLVFVPFLRASLTSCLAFVAGALPGPIAVATIHNAIYGAPLTSGYGPLRDIYALANVGPSVKLYPTWLWQKHGAFIFVGLIAPLALIVGRQRHPPRTRRIVVFALIFSAVLFLSYVGYPPFDNWTYTRFLLPAIPFLLLLGVWAVFSSARRVGSPALQVVAFCGVVLVACAWVGRAIDGHILNTKLGDSRYIAAGEYIDAGTAPNTIVIAMQHSGSIRYYGNRITVRYDWLNGPTLDQAIEWIHSRNRGPVLVFDDWEEARFRQRFRDQRWGKLDWPARVELEWQPKVRVYDPYDRDRFLANDRVQTARISPPQ